MGRYQNRSKKISLLSQRQTRQNEVECWTITHHHHNITININKSPANVSSHHGQSCCTLKPNLSRSNFLPSIHITIPITLANFQGASPKPFQKTWSPEALNPAVEISNGISFSHYNPPWLRSILRLLDASLSIT